MRKVGPGDLLYAARAVQQVPLPEQRAHCATLLWRAHVADKYVKRLRRLHPLWGDGSLRGAVVADGVPPALSGGDLCRALGLVLAVLDDDSHLNLHA